MYLVVSAILLLNMLIAMMGATFSVVADNQKEEYMNLNSRIVIAADMDLGDAPPPLSFLRLPYLLYTAIMNKSSSILFKDSPADLRTWTSFPFVSVLQTILYFVGMMSRIVFRVTSGTNVFPARVP